MPGAKHAVQLSSVSVLFWLHAQATCASSHPKLALCLVRIMIHDSALASSPHQAALLESLIALLSSWQPQSQAGQAAQVCTPGHAVSQLSWIFAQSAGALDMKRWAVSSEQTKLVLQCSGAQNLSLPSWDLSLDFVCALDHADNAQTAVEVPEPSYLC